MEASLANTPNSSKSYTSANPLTVLLQATSTSWTLGHLSRVNFFSAFLTLEEQPMTIYRPEIRPTSSKGTEVDSRAESDQAPLDKRITFNESPTRFPLTRQLRLKTGSQSAGIKTDVAEMKRKQLSFTPATTTFSQNGCRGVIPMDHWILYNMCS